MEDKTLVNKRKAYCEMYVEMSLLYLFYGIAYRRTTYFLMSQMTFVHQKEVRLTVKTYNLYLFREFSSVCRMREQS